MKIHVIGCGGGASHFLPNFLRSYPNVKLTLQDGDTLEERNLDRQLFDKRHVGKNKATALALTLRVKCSVVESYWTSGSPIHGDVVLCFADNNTCRRELLAAIDNEERDILFVTAANGERDAQSYAYHKSLKGTDRDCRVIFPGILEPDYSPAYACTAPEVAAERPQTLLANAMSAMLAHQIFRSWWTTYSIVDHGIGIDEWRPPGRPVSVYADLNNTTTIKVPLE